MGFTKAQLAAAGARTHDLTRIAEKSGQFERAQSQETDSGPRTLSVRQWLEKVDAQVQQPDLMDGLILPAGMTIIGGRQKLGKSFLATEMALLLSSGSSHGPLRPLGRSISLYYDLEGVEHKTAERFRAVQKGLRLDDTALDFVHMFQPRKFELLAPGGAANLVQDVMATGAQTVFLDTFAASFSGEENSKKDVQKYLNILAEIRLTTGCATVLVHHVNKASFGFKQTAAMMDPDGGLRGSSAIGAAYDVVLSLQEGWVKGEFIKAMIVRGKYCGDWWCKFEADRHPEPPKEGDPPPLERYSFRFLPRHNDYELFEVGPGDGQQSRFGGRK